ncbi:MAG: hypothetical protein ACEQSK_12980 [Sphingomonadaceae bacterium]
MAIPHAASIAAELFHHSWGLACIQHVTRFSIIAVYVERMVSFAKLG